jgi:hypothetical protein
VNDKCANVSCKNEATNFIHLNTNEIRKSCQLHILGMLQMNKDSFEILKDDFEHLLNNCRYLCLRIK